MNKTNVVIYTPVEDFFYNSPDAGLFILLLASLVISVFIALSMAREWKQDRLFWPKVIGAIGCMTYTLYHGFSWLIAHL